MNEYIYISCRNLKEVNQLKQLFKNNSLTLSLGVETFGTVIVVVKNETIVDWTRVPLFEEPITITQYLRQKKLKRIIND